MIDLRQLESENCGPMASERRFWITEVNLEQILTVKNLRKATVKQQR